MILFLVGSISFCLAVDAQSVDTLTNKLTGLSSRLFSTIQRKTEDLDKQFTKQTEKYLKKIVAREARLKRKVFAVDSAAGRRLFGNSVGQYAALAQKLNKDSVILSSTLRGQYLANLDSEKVSLTFLQQHPELLGNKIDLANLQKSLEQIRQMQSNLVKASDAQEFVNQRKEEIKTYLRSLIQMPPGLKKEYQLLNQDQYYYAQQVEEYKDLINDPDKLFKKALSWLNELPAFKQFMEENSQLAALFGVPGSAGTAQALAGLQTRAQIQQMVQGQLSGGGPSAVSALQQNFESAQSQLDQYRDKLTRLGAGGPDVDMPNFKPNEEKTKTFFKRLEFGTNLQTIRNNYFPTTTDFGLSIGYKLGNTGTIGVGGSYKVGWGTDFQHIAVSSQGAGMRSFLDLKLKGSFYASGGFEYNYQQPIAGSLLSALTQTATGSLGWTRSGLIGLSKTVSVKSKIFKKTKLQLLWDFLSYEQVPKTQPIVFRVGYVFN